MFSEAFKDEYFHSRLISRPPQQAPIQTGGRSEEKTEEEAGAAWRRGLEENKTEWTVDTFRHVK